MARAFPPQEADEPGAHWTLWALWLLATAAVARLGAGQPSSEIRFLTEHFRQNDLLPLPVVMHRGLPATAFVAAAVLVVLGGVAFGFRSWARFMLALAIAGAVVFLAAHAFLFAELSTDLMRSAVEASAAP